MNDKIYDYKIILNASNYKINKEFRVEFPFKDEDSYTDAIDLIEILLKLSVEGSVSIDKIFREGNDASCYHAETVCVMYVEIS